MTRDEILRNLAVDKSLDRLIAKLCANDRYLVEEGKQELFVVLLEQPEEKLLELYHGEDDRLMRWINGTLTNFFQRERSPFYKKIQKPRKLTSKRPKREDDLRDDDFTQLIIEEVTDEFRDADEIKDFSYSYRAEQLDAAIQELSEFDKEIITLYLELGTYRKVSRRLSRPVDSIRRSVKRIKGILHIKLKKDLN